MCMAIGLPDAANHLTGFASIHLTYFASRCGGVLTCFTGVTPEMVKLGAF